MSTENYLNEFIENLKNYDEETTRTEDWLPLQNQTCNLIQILSNDNRIIDSSPFNVQFSLYCCAIYGNFITTNLFTNDQSKLELDRLIEKFLKSHLYLSIIDWLVKTKRNDKTLCYKLIETITNELNREKNLSKSFFYRDAAVWLIFELRHPQMSDYTAALLPIALNISDCVDGQVAIVGLRALTHIAKHSLRSRLRYYGQSDLIYDNLKRHLYTQQSRVFREIVPCLLEFLESFDPPPASHLSLGVSDDIERRGYDELMRFVLDDLYFTSNIDRKIDLVSHLDSITDRLGSSVVKFSKSYFRSVRAVLLSPETRSMFPDAKRMILANWAKLSHRFRPILRSISVDLLMTLIGFVDESFQFCPTTMSRELVDLTSELFGELAQFGGIDLSIIYRGVENVIVNKENFQVFIDNKIIDLA